MATKYTKDDLFKMLEELTESKKMKPTSTNWRNQSYPSISVVNRLFGGWSNFLSEAGVPAYNDLTGKKFGRLRVIYPLKERKNGRILWHCECECGNEIDVMATYLTGGDTRSCGCLKLETDETNLRKKYEATRVDGVVTSLLTSKKRKDNSSKVKGIHIRKLKNGKKSYHAYIGINKQFKYLGAFKTLDLASQARKNAERKYHLPLYVKYKKRIHSNFVVETGITARQNITSGWHYYAYFTLNGKSKYIGSYLSIEQAREARESTIDHYLKTGEFKASKPNVKTKQSTRVKIHELEDDVLFDEIRKLTKALGKRPNPLDYENADVALEKYGSWALFLRQAGIGWIDK